MIKELIALLDGRETGRVVRDNRGKLTFIYNEQWRNAADAYPLSLSMPLAASHARYERTGHDDGREPNGMPTLRPRPS